jgi:hypothetical protein
MEPWTNISVSPQDSEIAKINDLGISLGSLPDSYQKIRELITRFEVCHFKYKKHIQVIKDAILNLSLELNPEDIGKWHIRAGEEAWKKDGTGRSALGQQYLWVFNEWMNDDKGIERPKEYNEVLRQDILKWLGDRNEDTIRLVRLLIARLTWDWKSLEEFQVGESFEQLEMQICKMDVCHYAFSTNLNALLMGIGQLKAVEEFEGCGSFNNEIQESSKEELTILFDLLKSYISLSEKEDQIRAWLIASLMKTLKAQADLSEPLIEFK